MITRELIEHISEIRRNQLHQSNCDTLNSDPPAPQYYQQLQLLLQVADELRLKGTTKFMAKKYFDVLLQMCPGLARQNPVLAIITCLRTAVKVLPVLSQFNEALEVSQHYTLSYCVAQCSGQYSREDFVLCESYLVELLDFKFGIATPYDFVVVRSLLPHVQRAMEILSSIIDLAISLPQLRGASAQGIFIGSLLLSCSKKEENPISYNIIKAITHRWEEGLQISRILDRNLTRLLQQ